MAPHSVITYVYPRMISRQQARYSRHTKRADASFHEQQSSGAMRRPRPSVYVYKGYWGEDGEWVDTDGPGHWGADGEWTTEPEAEAAAPEKNPWELGEAGHWGPDGEWVSDLVPEAAPEEEEVDEAKKTGISRCGFSWDDAAAKMGASCEAGGWEGQCTPPEGTVDDPDSYWYGETCMLHTARTPA